MKNNNEINLICETDFVLKIKDESHWDFCDDRQKQYNVHRETKTILLRFRDNLDNQNEYNLIDYPLKKYYEDDIYIYLDILKKYYLIYDYGFIIANLPKKSKIYSHRDHGRYFSESHRLHIPIQTNPDVIFKIGSKNLNLKVGSIYEIDNIGSYHGVKNNGDSDRYHIILDIFGKKLDSFGK